MPVGRSGHAACCINVGDDHPLLLVTGGLDKENCVLKDAWLLDIMARSWKEVSGLALHIHLTIILYTHRQLFLFSTQPMTTQE